VAYFAGTGPEVDPINENLRAGRARGVEVFQTEINIHSLKMVHFTQSTSITFHTAKVSGTIDTVKQGFRDNNFHGHFQLVFIRKKRVSE